MNTVSCVKCKEPYQSSDPDPYYCPSCEEQKKRIAKEIDAKLSKVPRKETKSDWQIYQEANKIHGFVDARTFDI